MNNLLQASQDSGLLRIQLNRPDKKNALTGEMYTGLSKLFRQADTDDNIRVVLISGGDDFCAGNDLHDFLQQPGDFLHSPAGDFLLTVAEFSKPLVAAVDGYAIGIGTTLLLHSDLAYCSDRATFSLPFVNLGLVPEFAATLLLPKTAGYRLAAELLLLGEPFGAETAMRTGLVNGICAPENLLDYTLEVARKLAAKPQQALQQTRHLLRAQEEPVRDRIIREADSFTELLTTDDAKTAIATILNRSK
ncbi:MAG: enoyl-CoA hydratase-related protein [Porticoccaceae bacterium]